RRKPERRVFRSPFGWQDMLARLRRACPRRFPWRRPGRERGRRRGKGAEVVAGRSEVGVLAWVIRVSIPDAAFGLIRATCRSPGKRSAPGFPFPPPLPRKGGAWCSAGWLFRGPARGFLRSLPGGRLARAGPGCGLLRSGLLRGLLRRPSGGLARGLLRCRLLRGAALARGGLLRRLLRRALAWARRPGRGLACGLLRGGLPGGLLRGALARSGGLLRRFLRRLPGRGFCCAPAGGLLRGLLRRLPRATCRLLRRCLLRRGFLRGLAGGGFPARAGLLATAILLVDGRPGDAFGGFLAAPAGLLAFLDVFGLAFLLAGVAGLVTAWHGLLLLCTGSCMCR